MKLNFWQIVGVVIIVIAVIGLAYEKLGKSTTPPTTTAPATSK